MKRGQYRLCVGLGLVVLGALAYPALAQQGGGGGKPEMQQKIAALKQSLAQSKQSEKQYTWTETTQISLKGETKSTKRSTCQYGPDGKVQKTPIDSGQPAQSGGKKQRGLKAKVVEKKKDEMQDYMERAASLIKRYVPPDPARLQEVFKEGKAEIQQLGGGVVNLVFHDYAKPGDALSLAVNGSNNTMQGVTVKSYLDEPGDAVNLNVRYDNLVDGTNYVAETVLDATAKKIQVRTTNSGHHKP